MSNNSKYKSLLADTGLFAISGFGSKLLLFFFTPLYTSILTTREYGVVDLILTTISFAYPIVTLSISDATLRYTLDKAYEKNKVFSIATFITVISFFALFVTKPLIVKIDGALNQYWIAFFLIFCLSNILSYFASFTKGLQMTKLYAFQGIIHTVTIIVCNILFLVIIKLGLNGYLLSMIVGYLVPAIILFVRASLYKYCKPFCIDKQLLKDMLHYSIPLIPASLAWSINISIDKFMIIRMYSLGDSGIYSIAHKIPSMITTIFGIFLSAWYISAYKNSGSSDESEYYTTVYRGLDLLAVIGSFLIIIFNKSVATILFSKDFYAAWKYVPFLMISSLFSTCSGFLASAYRAAKKTMNLLISVFVGAIVNVVLNYVLLKRVGVIGAAIATAVSFFVVWFSRIIIVQKIVRIRISIITTVMTYLLLLCAASVCTLDFNYAILINAGLLGIVLMLNKKMLSHYLYIAQSLVKGSFAKFKIT